MRPVTKDYLISLPITLIICIIAWVIISFPTRRYFNSIYSLTDVSDGLTESKNQNRFVAEYQLNSALSKIDSLRTIPDTTLWVEKNSLGYYRDNDTSNIPGSRIHISDTIQDDFIIHLDKMIDDKTGGYTTIDSYKYYCALWKDKHTKDILGKSCSNWIHFIDRCPDSLLVTTKRDEFVYKGEICLIKEK